MAITPDGTNVLLMKNLSATGMICEFDPKCPPPTPQSAAIAELRDIATGKLVWSIDEIAKRFSGTNPPAISPDGKFALISMPYTFVMEQCPKATSKKIVKASLLALSDKDLTTPTYCK